MNGMQHMNTQQSGHRLLSLISAILTMLLFFNSCAGGRGDYTIELLNGYAVSKINSREMLFGKKDGITETSYTIVISHYFVKAFQLHDPYILLQGIETKELCISDEELEANKRVYYFVDSSSENIVGPFETIDQLSTCCNLYEIVLLDEWTSIEKYG